MVLAGALAPAGYVFVAAVLTALLNRQTRAAERAVEDPPRPDHERETRARRAPLNLDAVRRYDPVAADAAESLRTYTALLSALVRALERAQGASLEDDESDYSERLFEAAEFARRIVDASLPIAGDLMRFALELDTPRRLTPPLVQGELSPKRLPRPKPRRSADAETLTGKRLLDVLPESIKRQLRDARVPLSALDVRLPADRDVTPRSAAASLRQVATSMELFGETLRFGGLGE